MANSCPFCPTDLGFQKATDVADPKDRTMPASRRPRPFNLGNRVFETDPDKAAELLLRREAPDIADIPRNKNPHRNLFVPDVFLQNDKGVSVVDPDWRRNPEFEYLRDGGKLDLNRLTNFAIGDNNERKHYNNILEYFKNEDQEDISVFHSVLGHPNLFGKKIVQFDIVMICRKQRLIFYIEAKNMIRTHLKGEEKMNPIEKAHEQYGKFDTFVKDYFPVGKNWLLVKCYATQTLEDDEGRDYAVCDGCRRFIIFGDTDFKRWWDSLNGYLGQHGMQEVQENLRKSVYNVDDDDIIYKKIVELLLFTHLWQLNHFLDERKARSEKVFDLDKTAQQLATEKIQKHLDVVGQYDTIFFWTAKQEKYLLHDARCLIFTSQFGSGKTLLLKMKAIEIAEKSPKDEIFMVVMPPMHKKLPEAIHHPKKGFLSYDFEVCVANFGNMRVIDWSILKECAKLPGEALLEFMAKHPNAHYFIDELHIKNGDYVDQLQSRAEKTLWMANNADFELNSKPTKVQVIHKLSGIMRNTKEIQQLAGLSDIRENFPEGRSVPPMEFYDISVDNLDTTRAFFQTVRMMIENLSRVSKSLPTIIFQFVPRWLRMDTFTDLLAEALKGNQTTSSAKPAKVLTCTQRYRNCQEEEIRAFVHNLHSARRRTCAVIDMIIAEGMEFVCGIVVRRKLKEDSEFLTQRNLILRITTVVGEIVCISDKETRIAKKVLRK